MRDLYELMYDYLDMYRKTLCGPICAVDKPLGSSRVVNVWNIVGSVFPLSLVHIQSRFRFMSYSNGHETSDLHSQAFQGRARTARSRAALERRFRLAPLPDAFGEFEGRRGPANSQELGLRSANGARRHP